MVTNTWEEMRVFDFLLGLCLIVGGFLTVSSIIESIIRNVFGSVEKKVNP